MVNEEPKVRTLQKLVHLLLTINYNFGRGSKHKFKEFFAFLLYILDS